MPNDFISEEFERQKRLREMMEPTGVRLFREEQDRMARLRKMMDPVGLKLVREESDRIATMRANGLLPSLDVLVAARNTTLSSSVLSSLEGNLFSRLKSETFGIDTSAIAGAALAIDQLSKSLQDTISPTLDAINKINSGLTRSVRDTFLENLNPRLEGILSWQQQVNQSLSSLTFDKLGIDSATIETARAYLEAEAQREAEEDEQAGRNTVLSAVRKAIETLNKNTATNLKDASWFDVLTALLVLFEIMQQIAATDEEDILDAVQANTAEVVQLREDAATQRDQIEELLTDFRTDAATLQVLANLPRASVTSRGIIRDEPSGSAKLLTRLQAADELAIVEKDGRWRRVVYRDTLTEELAEGWIYASSIEEF